MKAAKYSRAITTRCALIVYLLCCFGATWLSAARQGGVTFTPDPKAPKAKAKAKPKKNVETPVAKPTPVALPEAAAHSAPMSVPTSISTTIEWPEVKTEAEPNAPTPPPTAATRAPPPPATPATRLATPPAAIETFAFKTPTYDKRGRVKKEDPKTVRTYREAVDSTVWLEMIEVPGGEFIMGSPVGELDSQADTERERPLHKVKVPTFWSGKYEVTQGQWRAVAQLPKVKTELKPEPSKFKGDDNLPVDTISWYDAVEFCARLQKQTGRAYRLLTEAEWEYAARAGTTTPFAFGETITPEIANYDGRAPYWNTQAKGEARGKTVPVGSLGRPNAFGLFDLHGNLWEWCQDQYHTDYKGAPTDGSAWESQEPSFNINEQSLVRLRSAGAPEEVLKKLQRLKDRVFTGEGQFLSRLNAELGEEQTAKLKALIFNHAAWDMPRVIRGGSWSDGGGNCRSATRADYGYPTVRREDHGFRIAVNNIL